MTARKWFCIVAGLLMVSGCGSAPYDVHTYKFGQHGGAGSSGAHVVAAGDSVYALAERYRLDMRDIITVNNLNAPYTLEPGQHLLLPPPREYKVRAGDSLYTVSRLFGVSVTDIARLNNLRTPYTVVAGSTLRIPVTAVEETVTRQHVAMKGAASTDVIERETLAPVNRPSRPGAVTAEVLPAPSPVPSSGPSAGASPSSASIPAPDVRPANQASPKLAAKIPETVPPRASSKFLRPVEGNVISSYGAKAGGLHNDGINIKAAKGTPVKAAENGVVVYASNEMKGYGNMVLIRHADRWMTAYSHMDSISIKRGDTVKRGQAIGTVGMTGSVDTPQLHFEIRRGVQALNPEAYLDGRKS
ncbi:lysM domain protein [Micavibrio aeruginosavorus ARL-13]|uniref:LysM domain protein n=2 Tax=Micavibrio aeruginosavorus TaxID=349221 RepID=G2KRB3_MICAA|nr:lysM domain protein [Micavibrio aeruginosavorus ARL-13]